MKNIAVQKKIFDLLHDGIIIDIKSHEENIISLTIEIQYLAQKISSTHSCILLELVECDSIYLTHTPNSKLITELSNVVLLEPEILRCISSKNSKDSLDVLCELNDRSTGILSIKTNKIHIYDQEKNILSYNELQNIAAE